MLPLLLVGVEISYLEKPLVHGLLLSYSLVKKISNIISWFVRYFLPFPSFLAASTLTAEE